MWCFGALVYCRADSGSAGGKRVQLTFKPLSRARRRQVQRAGQCTHSPAAQGSQLRLRAARHGTGSQPAHLHPHAVRLSLLRRQGGHHAGLRNLPQNVPAAAQRSTAGGWDWGLHTRQFLIPSLSQVEANSQASPAGQPTHCSISLLSCQNTTTPKSK